MQYNGCSLCTQTLGGRGGEQQSNLDFTSWRLWAGRGKRWNNGKPGGRIVAQAGAKLSKQATRQWQGRTRPGNLTFRHWTALHCTAAAAVTNTAPNATDHLLTIASSKIEEEKGKKDSCSYLLRTNLVSSKIQKIFVFAYFFANTSN